MSFWFALFDKQDNSTIPLTPLTYVQLSIPFNFHFVGLCTHHKKNKNKEVNKHLCFAIGLSAYHCTTTNWTKHSKKNLISLSM